MPLVALSLGAALGGPLSSPSATELAIAIRSGETTSSAVLEAHLARIQELNPQLNAIVTLDTERAFARARQADDALARGEVWGPLHGVPLTVKDTFATAGLRTTAGHPTLSSWIPDDDATVVQLLREAGAILIGKTNTPELAMDMQTDNALFGRTLNAWDPTRTAGGSSGGCSVAVATGMSALSVGSDLAGSLRIPTAFNGVYGLRPSHGVISFRGHVPPRPQEVDGVSWNLAVAGPITRTPEDLALLLDVLARPHPTDRRVIPLRPYDGGVPEISSLQIAFVDGFGGVPVSAEVVATLEAFAGRLAAAGAVVERRAPAGFEPVAAWETWGALVGMQGGYDRSNFARRLGKLFVGGKVRPIPMHRRILDPISVPGYMSALAAQARIADAVDALLDEVDVWVVPVASTTAFPHHAPSGRFGEFLVYDDPLRIDGAPVPYYIATQSYTTVFSVSDHPVVSMPIGRDRDGLPVGVQVVGRRYDDHRLVQIVRALAQAVEAQPQPASRAAR